MRLLHFLDSLLISRSTVVVAVLVLVAGYVPLTGLDHLHLHVDHDNAFAHDHLNIGHHSHDHHHHHGDEPHGDESESESRESFVIGFAQAAQEKPAQVTIQVFDGPAADEPWARSPERLGVSDPHPSWSSRAPPS